MKSSVEVSAPDGGWGWVIVLSAFITQILVDGLGMAYGVLLPKFVEYFQAERSKVSLIGSLLIGTFLCTGPFAGGLIDKFGCRFVSITGSVVSAIGVIIGSFSPNLDVLIVSYGVIGGIGFGMMYLSSVVSVGMYFDKRRPLATGIYMCGSGIGTFIFSPVLEYLFEVYNWRGALLIVAGIILNGSVCGVLIRPLQARTKSTKTISHCDLNYTEVQNQFIQISAENIYVKNGQQFSNDKLLNEIKPLIQVSESTVGTKNSTLDRISLSKSNVDVMNQIDSVDDQSATTQYVRKGIPSALHQKSLSNLQFYGSEIICQPESKPEMLKKPCCLQRCISFVFREVIEVSVLTNVPFLLMCISTVFCSSAFYIPFTYLVDRAIILGIPSTDAAFLLSIIGIVNTIGRVSSGYLANLPNANAIVICSVALVISSVACFLQPFCTVYPLLVVFCVIFGLGIASYAALSTIIMCELFDVNMLAKALGLFFFTRGFSSVTGPYIAGMVFQATGNYDASFYLGGGMFFLGAILRLTILLPCVKRS